MTRITFRQRLTSSYPWLIATAFGLVVIYAVTAFFTTINCYVELKQNSNARFMENSELWRECARDNLYFPFYYFT